MAGEGWSVSLDQRCYRPSQILRATLSLPEKLGAAQNGVTAHAKGVVNLQQHKNASLLDAFSSKNSNLKPIIFFQQEKQIIPKGKVQHHSAQADTQFEFALEPIDGHTLLETYHGVYVSITYSITFEVAIKGMLATKNYKHTIEFHVQAPGSVCTPIKSQRQEFCILPDSLETSGKKDSAIPKFKILGHFDSTECDISRPITGQVVVEECSASIKSIELQLVRVEAFDLPNASLREVTEIQNIQVGEGDVLRRCPIPLHMVFPRLFTCPSVSTTSFRINFEVNFVLLFTDGFLISKAFPLLLRRLT